MGIRRNIANNAAARDAYVQGVQLLKQELTGITTAALGISARPGQGSQQLSTWDLFVYWHVRAMNEATPAGSTRNAAHSGPAFLPWHRWMLLLLEFQFQRVLGDANFGLPYWDWAADGELPVAQQPTRPVWAANALGGDGRASDGEVTTGPFRRTGNFRVRIETDVFGRLWATNRPLRRRFRSRFGTSLPNKADVTVALNETNYDESPWSGASDGMRNYLEGWRPSPPARHNAVHVWIDGDMGPASSPNDPAFYMNHCNVDRIWAAWQNQNPNRPYVPPQSASSLLFRHRRNDPLNSVLTSLSPTVAQMLNVSNFYTYDSLQVD